MFEVKNCQEDDFFAAELPCLYYTSPPAHSTRASCAHIDGVRSERALSAFAVGVDHRCCF